MEFTPGLLLDRFDPLFLERGLDYFHQGRVEDVQRLEQDGGFVLLASVQGSGRRLYTQEVHVRRYGSRVEIDGYCSCPVAYQCKHVAAVCLAWSAMAAEDPAPDTRFEAWLERVTDAATPGAERGGTDNHLLYQLAPAPGRPQMLAVHFRVSRRKRDGDWGAGRAVSFSTLGDPWRRTDYLSPEDVEILSLLRASGGEPFFHDGAPVLEGIAGGLALQLMLETDRIFWGTPLTQPLQVGAERAAALAWTNDGESYRLSFADPELEVYPRTDPPLYVDTRRLEAGPLRLPEGVDARLLAALPQAPSVPASEAARISRTLALRMPDLPTPEPVEVETLVAEPVPCLHLLFDRSEPFGAHLALGFRYGEAVLEPGETRPAPLREAGERLVRVQRDPETEQSARDVLLGMGTRPLSESPHRFQLDVDPADAAAILYHWLRFVETAIPDLEAGGWEIYPDATNAPILSRAEGVDAEVESSERDWFDLRFDLEVEGRRIPLLPLVAQLIGRVDVDDLPETLYLDAGDGHFIAVAGEMLRPVLKTLLDLFDREPAAETLRLSRLDAPRLLDFDAARLRGAGRLKKLARRMRDFEGVRPVPPPSTFKGALRPYQQQGLDWLQFLREYELAGILADDMGLGKTVQTLAHLAVEKRAGRMRHPSLIIAPTSLLGNWRREAAQFTPKLRVLILQGPDRRAWFDSIEDHDLVLTTYPLLTRDDEVLLNHCWHYLILDEAQQIKNPRARSAQVVRTLEVNHRLCLTGTPMENHLGELWAQFDFLLPGFLGDQKTFNQHYRKPIEQGGERGPLERLRQRTAPFILRRTKDRVARELPPKTELLRTTALDTRQGALYESIRLSMEKKVREAVERQGLARSHITILDALLKLRQVCCDPRLVRTSEFDTHNIRSAKLEMLMELVPELLEEGRRILLFSQFTSMLTLIGEQLDKRGIAYTKLTGQTRKREAAIERFRRGEVDLFLISLKAGGVGLNLTEADTVIHYDPWWNPAVESQATDRAHRINQHKPVFVYKLVTEGTVEEKILALQAQKQQLADQVHGRNDSAAADELPIDAETLQRLLTSD
ncbi:DEAD/DEAH box helicase [Thioalkalivibrio sp. ALJT]|uniref:DEAD/DEAH box helicase n=1 Tax=Thioalkalivibrio sp. ALJT TaxID=1158146 RepID=UPI00038116A9|nr:DEAD/DEAH box helicase [Thioalkalivibrio sp. ALJT]